MCGGAPTTRDPAKVTCGLSPRVRGSPPSDPSDGFEGRSIPACAGEPPGHGIPPGVIRVYPRVCGGAPLAIPRTASRGGLSPRVRGSRGASGPGEDA